MVVPDEREVPPEERETELLPEVDGARLTAEEALRVVTPERLEEALRVVTPERLADVDLLVALALRLPVKLRVDVVLRPAERTDPPCAREEPA